MTPAAAPGPSELSRWIAGTPALGRFRLFSAPVAFEMPEEEYERRIGARHGGGEGEAVFRLFRHLGGDTRGAALELGCGGGAATVGFVGAAHEMEIIVTDPSPAFLRIVEEKLRRAERARAGITLGTLSAEELGRLPRGTLDLVFLQACLHHVLDPRRFLEDAAAALKPGGVLIFEEPFAEGYLMLAMAAELLLALDRKAVTLRGADRDRLRGMLDGIYFQCDRTRRKDEAEDKHCFLTDDLLSACWRTFADVHFFRNQSFASIAQLSEVADASLAASCRGSLVDYARAFMVHHHLVSEPAVRAFDGHVAPALARVDRLFRNGDGPTMFATVACKTAA
jgi:SAM-dependent methyltransferase